MEDRLGKNQFCSAIILAAGKSSRMGMPKFGLSYNKKMTFLEEIVSCYTSFGCQEIIVLLNEKGTDYLESQSIQLPSNCTIVKNSHLEWERFYSIKLGMLHLQYNYPVFIHNVDNPFVNSDVLSSLLQNHSNADYVVPVFEGRGGHPILVSEKTSTAIKNQKKNDSVLSDFLKNYTKKVVQVADEKVLTNINTEAAYIEFKSS